MNIPISNIKVGDRTRRDMGDIPVLARSIQSVGLLHPVVVDGKNNLIAGARRLEAVKALGWDDVPVTICPDLSDVSKALSAERDENTCREDFRPDEAWAMGKRIEEMERPKAKAFQSEAGSSRGIGKIGSGKLPEAIGDTRDVVGSSIGISGKTWEKLDKVMTAAKADPEKFGDLPEKMADGKVDRAFRELRKREAVEKVVDAPAGKYRVLYADPPWRYGDTRSGLEGTTGAESHYPTMSISELCALPVSEWSQDDAVLFLWVTSPMLFECAPVIKAWGFEYKASFVWDKVKHNLGHYNSVRHELLLVCTRGSCTPDNVNLFDSVQSIERTEHSRKPEEFRTIIETLYPNGKRLELFARVKSKGWHAYGNDRCS